jgi:GntR family transcriptional regulator
MRTMADEPRDGTWRPPPLRIDTDRPLYEQIAAMVRTELAGGRLQPGDRMPSVRDLAAQYRVNPNTVMRAYQELERERILTTVRGQGTFIVNDPAVILESRRRQARAAWQALCDAARQLGLHVDDLIRLARETKEDGADE